uniref:FERM domain-containing protein n=1 Tax=Gasterosteus aculeatus aculeatus TaxID=481459 RepID=A0AAQ4Q9X6_GASAC
MFFIRVKDNREVQWKTTINDLTHYSLNSLSLSQEQQEVDQVSHRSSISRLSRSPLKGVKKTKIMECKVALLDGSDFTLNLEKRARGHVLFDKICEHLNLLEKDYFGITCRDVENQKNWIDPGKELKKQIRTGPWNFAFNVKFYPPDPAQLTEDITRYYLCLQLRDDVVSGRLPCSFATHTVLGSYAVQSELGDYDPEELGSDYISELRFAPNQTKELEEKVMELHKTYKGMTPAEAEIHFLENAKKLSMYGVDLHHAKDSEGVEIMLGVCSSGLLIYRDRLRINRFAWPKILKISYKRNNFYIKIRPGEFEQFESTIGFKLPNHRAAKRLWKVCVEHHTFFRLVSPESQPKKFLSLGSKFRYSGRTQAQSRRASSMINRLAPLVERSSSKRYNMSLSLDGAPIAENHETPMKDSAAAGAAKILTKGDLITTVTTEKKAEEEKAEQEDAPTDAAETQEPTTPLRHDTKVNCCGTSSDTSPPEEMLKHQTNISELKRSFLETGESSPGLTEWEKRLSSSPAHSPRGDEAPMIEPLELQDVSRGAAPLSEPLRQCASVELAAEIQPPATHLELDESLSAVLTSAEDKIDEEGEAFMEKHGNYSCGFTVAAAPVGCGENEEKLLLTNGEHNEEEEAAESCLEALEEELLGLNDTGERKHTEVDGRRVQFSNQVQYFEEHVFPPGMENGFEEVGTKEVPVVHTETKTITYESAEVETNGDVDPGVLLSAQTITSETTSTTTTTHITKTVKGGISETRIEKRIVITGDTDIDHDQALAQAIKEAKEQHPDMSVTKVVVHKETEITPEEGED